MHGVSPDLQFSQVGKWQLHHETLQSLTVPKIGIRKGLALCADWPKCSLAVSGEIITSLLGCRILMQSARFTWTESSRDRRVSQNAIVSSFIKKRWLSFISYVLIGARYKYWAISVESLFQQLSQTYQVILLTVSSVVFLSCMRNYGTVLLASTWKVTWIIYTAAFPCCKPKLYIHVELFIGNHNLYLFFIGKTILFCTI